MESVSRFTRCSEVKDKKRYNFPVFGPCMLTSCSCQAAAVGWERGPLRPAGGAEGSAPGRSTAAAPEDCRQRQRSQLGASESGRWGTKGRVV